MSLERILPALVSGAGGGRTSIDDTTSLNDDLADESVYSSDSNLSPNSRLKHYHRSSSRNSIDNESLALSSAYFSLFRTNDDIDDSSNSPLGPNGIYELTTGSDIARLKLTRLVKNAVSLHGGSVTVPNIRVPSVKDIPQILLLKLKQKVSNNELEHMYVTDLLHEYQQFESGQKQLTEESLSKFLKEEEKAQSGQKEHVPEVFMQEDFRLDDPRVFRKVFGNMSILPAEDYNSSDIISTKNLANNNEIQERFSLYLDAVEIDLIDEISRSSESFFSAIGNVQNIQVQSVKCAEKFLVIQDKLADMADNQAQLGREILRKMVEYKNIEHLESTMVQLKYAVTMYKSATSHFEKQSYSRCLAKIQHADLLIAGKRLSDSSGPHAESENPKLRYPLADLTRLPALVNTRNDLGVLKDKAGKGYISEFHNYLLDDMRQYYRSHPIDITLSRMYCSIAKSAKKVIDNSFQVLAQDTRTQLSEYVATLSGSGFLTQAYAAYEDRVISEVKDIIKQNLPNKNDVHMESLSALEISLSRSASPLLTLEKSGQLGLNLSGLLKTMSPQEFETILKKMYAQLSECLRRLTSQQKVLLDLALSASLSLPHHLQFDVMRLDISPAIHKAIELTQVRLTRVLNVRLEQTADLMPNQYLRQYALSSAYSQDCEIIDPGHVMSGPGSNSLGDWLKQHIAYFTHRYHHNVSKSIAQSCDGEVWKEVTSSATLSLCQSQLDQIVEYSDYFSSGGEKGNMMDAWLQMFDFNTALPENKDTALVDESCKRLKVDKQLFMVPPLAITLVQRVLGFLVIAKAFPGASKSIQANVLNYFKLVNTKVFQAVLNAGATRTAGLKHIFPKHIALCIQFVQFSLSVLEKVGYIFSANDSTQIAPIADEYADELTFPRIISNFKDHENKLFAKVVSIVHDRTVLHCTKIVKIDWQAPLPATSQCHEYMESLVRETITVSKSLLKYLLEFTSTLILLQIFDNYKRLLVECYCTQLPQFKDFNEKYTVLKDIDYFRVKLCEIPGYGNSGQVLWENVNALPTLEDARMEQVMKLNIEDELQERKLSLESTREIRQDVRLVENSGLDPQSTDGSLQGAANHGVDDARTISHVSPILSPVNAGSMRDENAAVDDNAKHASPILNDDHTSPVIAPREDHKTQVTAQVSLVEVHGSPLDNQVSPAEISNSSLETEVVSSEENGLSSNGSILLSDNRANGSENLPEPANHGSEVTGIETLPADSGLAGATNGETSPDTPADSARDQVDDFISATVSGDSAAVSTSGNDLPILSVESTVSPGLDSTNNGVDLVEDQRTDTEEETELAVDEPFVADSEDTVSGKQSGTANPEVLSTESSAVSVGKQVKSTD